MSTQKTYKQKSEITVINEQGEIIRSEREITFKTRKETEPAFVKLYLEDIHRLLSLKKGTLEILFELASISNYNKNTVILNSGIKKEIAKKLKISEGTLNNSLSELKKGKIIELVAGGVFLIDTKLIAKGQWSVIKTVDKDKAKNSLI